MQIEELYISLIVRLLKNEISEKEKQELFKWIYHNHENEKFFYHIKDIWETAQFNRFA
jgi:ferric-dicitrate binding protein FerR (iron transport regulator)